MANKPGEPFPNRFRAERILRAGEFQKISDNLVRRITGGKGVRVRTFGSQIIIETDSGGGGGGAPCEECPPSDCIDCCDGYSYLKVDWECYDGGYSLIGSGSLYFNGFESECVGLTSWWWIGEQSQMDNNSCGYQFAWHSPAAWCAAGMNDDWSMSYPEGIATETEWGMGVPCSNGDMIFAALGGGGAGTAPSASSCPKCCDGS